MVRQTADCARLAAHAHLPRGQDGDDGVAGDGDRVILEDSVRRIHRDDPAGFNHQVGGKILL